MLAWPDTRITAVDSGAAALDSMGQCRVDCVILTPHLADMTVAALAERIMSGGTPSLHQAMLYLGAAEIGGVDMSRWSHLAQEFGLALADSPQRLIDSVSLTLGLPLVKLDDASRQTIKDLHNPSTVLAGKRVLIVDDDIRNIFALTSVLERHDVISVSAETGRDAINLLHTAPKVDIVLMDIMMPEMDGLDTMRASAAMSVSRTCRS